MFIKWVIGRLLSPLTTLGEKYLDNQKDKEKLKHGTLQVAIQAETSVRQIKLSGILSIPLLVAEASAAIYIASIFIDSTYPSDWVNPLELPGWFQPHFEIIMASLFGLGVVSAIRNRK